MKSEEILKHQRDLSKARSKKYYENHKKKILEKRKLEREKFRQEIEVIKEKQKLQFVETIPIVPEPEPEPEIIINNTADYTREDIINLFKKKNYVPGTEKTYLTDINRIFRVTGCKTIIPCLKNTQMIIDDIKKGTYRGKPYKVNSLKQTFQVLLTIIDRFLTGNTNFDKNEFKQIRNKIETEYNRYKEMSFNETKEKIKNEFVPTFKQYLQEVKQMFGKDSKQYLLALLYSIFTVRDNFKAMKIIKSQNDNDGINNFILVDGETMKIFINDFKTKKKFETLKYTYNPNNADENELKELIEKWISSNGLAYGDYIFKKSPISRTISEMNKQLNYEKLKGIDMYRHVRVTEEYGKNLSFDERMKLANEMGHSVFTASKYKRNIQVI
jgi:vacuolar-type H+-ATPase subunit H